jgi:hypothetical protein
MGSFIFPAAIVIEVRASTRIRYQVTSEMHLINYEYDTLANVILYTETLRFGSGVRRVRRRIALPVAHRSVSAGIARNDRKAIRMPEAFRIIETSVRDLPIVGCEQLE